MKISQLSVFLENRPHSLLEPLQALAAAGIDLSGIALADSEQFGILRLVLRDWARARGLLQSGGWAVTVTDMVAIHVEDQLYLLDLMSRTNPGHTWGVGHDRERNVVHVSMKNGWVQFKSIDNLWGVNSMGYVQGKGRSYVAAIMSRMPTFDEGRALVDAIGADTESAVEQPVIRLLVEGFQDARSDS